MAKAIQTPPDPRCYSKRYIQMVQAAKDPHPPPPPSIHPPSPVSDSTYQVSGRRSEVCVLVMTDKSAACALAADTACWSLVGASVTRPLRPCEDGCPSIYLHLLWPKSTILRSYFSSVLGVSLLRKINRSGEEQIEERMRGIRQRRIEMNRNPPV